MEILTKLLEFRGWARRLFQRYQLIIEPLFRFVISYLAFHTINTALAYNATVANPVIELGLAAVGAFLPPVVLILLCAILVVMTRYIHLTRPARTALACLLGGGIGNLIDRLIYGGVTDYIHLLFIDFPVFNLADIAITLSFSALLYLMITKRLETE